MLNKSLLVPVVGNENYTHLLTVASLKSGLSYGYAINIANYGGIKPTALKPGSESAAITQVASVVGFPTPSFGDNPNKTYLFFEGRLAYHDIKDICLGRFDTKKYLGYPDDADKDRCRASWRDNSFIRREDIGKTIPIWLSFAPPLGPDSCKRSLFHGGCVNVREGDAFGEQEVGASDRKQFNCSVISRERNDLCKRRPREGIYNSYRRWLGVRRPSVLCDIPCNDQVRSEVGAPSPSNKQCQCAKGTGRQLRKGLQCHSYRSIQACNNRRLRRILTFRMGGSHAE